MRLRALLLVLALAGCGFHGAQGPVEASQRPLQLNPVVTQANIADTICNKSKDATGQTWVQRQRPPVAFTNKVKADLIAKLPAGTSHTPADYELDHLVSLALGGAPTDLKNLWLQPISAALAWDTDLEAGLSRAVCDHIITLADAQKFERDHK